MCNLQIIMKARKIIFAIAGMERINTDTTTCNERKKLIALNTRIERIARKALITLSTLRNFASKFADDVNISGKNQVMILINTIRKSIIIIIIIVIIRKKKYIFKLI